jgi:uncharacterized membrane protein
MSTSHHRWLHQQLPQWEQDGLLSADAASTLRHRHPVDSSQPGVAQLVMGALGALLIGTGLIAIIGSNWDAFSRPVRLLFAFLPLLGSQAFSLHVLRRGTAAAGWIRETAALLQTLAIGACIALVSQIYHLGGDWPDFLFWWFLLTLPLVWVLRSRAAAIFYLIAIATWSVNQVQAGQPWHNSPLLYPVLLLGVLPYWPGLSQPRQPLSLSVRWIMAISAAAGLCSTAAFMTSQGSALYRHADTFLWLCTLTAAGFTLFPLTHAGINESIWRKPQVILGTLWLLGYAMVATFHEVSDDVLRGASSALTLPWAQGLLAVLLGLALLAAKQRRWAVLSIASVVLLPLLLQPLVHAGTGDHFNWLSSLITLHLSILGITLILLEFAGKPSAPRLGAALLSLLIMLRMADSHFSFLAKGITFILIGVAFLGFNILMSRHHRRTHASPA